MNGSQAASVNGWGPVPVGEVLDAVLALKRREFRRGTVAAATRQLPAWRPEPGEAPILVVGCSGSAGASTVALLLAELASRSRVIECAPPASSGLVGAATAELGERDGWVVGRRGDVGLQRRRDHLLSPAEVPVPLSSSPGMVTVVDLWWDLRQVLAAQGWLADLARTCPRVVVVTRATVPGMRQLESNLAVLEPERCWAVTTDVAVHRWSRPMEQALGPLARQLHRDGHVLRLPAHHGLAVAGITTEPLPHSLMAPAARLLRGLLP